MVRLKQETGRSNTRALRRTRAKGRGSAIPVSTAEEVSTHRCEVIIGQLREELVGKTSTKQKLIALYRDGEKDEKIQSHKGQAGAKIDHI